MKKTNFLSAQEKEQGFSNLMKHSMWNGLGFSFLTETIIYLMAIYFQATNVQLGYISSTLYLSGVVLLIVPRLFAGVRLKQIYFWGWFLRGIACLAYLLLFLLEGQAAVWVIMITYTAFCVFRTLGVAANQPIVKSLMNSNNEGSRLIQLSSILSRSSLVSRTISFAFLSIAFLSGIRGLIFLTVLGVLVNSMSSYYITRIPSREKVDPVKGSQGIFSIFKSSMADKNIRYYLIVLWLFTVSGVLNGFTIPFLQREAGIASNLIFLYTMIGVGGGLISNYFVKPYIDKTGSKPLLVLVTLIMGLTFIIWALIPPDTGYPVFLVLGLVHSFLMSLGFNLTNRLLFKVLPKDKNRLAFSSMNSFVSAVIALITGLAAGKIADFSSARIEGLPHTYSLVFLIASAVVFLLSQAAYFLKDQGSLTVKETSELIFLTRNRRAYLWTWQLASAEDPQKRESTLLSLEKSDTHLATREMEHQLNSPYSWEKERILRSLYSYPRPELAPMVLAEASDVNSYNRRDALFALARYPGGKTEKVLMEALEDSDPLVISMALKSLTRLDEEKYVDLPDLILPSISHSSRAVNDWFISCCEVDPAGRHLKMLFELASPPRGYRFQQLIFCLAARYYGQEILLAPYYQKFNADPLEGLNALLEEIRGEELFLVNEDKIGEWFLREDYESFMELMKRELPYPHDEGVYLNLKVAVDTLTPELMNQSAFMALLYFSYQIILGSGEAKND